MRPATVSVWNPASDTMLATDMMTAAQAGLAHKKPSGMVVARLTSARRNREAHHSAAVPPLSVRPPWGALATASHSAWATASIPSSTAAVTGAYGSSVSRRHAAFPALRLSSARPT